MALIRITQLMIMYSKYKKLLKLHPNIIITGRLGKYKYIDMDDCISLAIKESKKLC